MANLRDLRGRIKSVENIRKITSTMEMVATARAKKSRDIFNAARPYSRALRVMSQRLIASTWNQPSQNKGWQYFKHEEETKESKVLQILVTADRGLCGGFNSAVLNVARRYRAEAASDQLTIFAAGRKGLNGLKLQKQTIAEQWIQFEGHELSTSREIADKVKAGFDNGDWNRVELIYTEFFSAGRQYPIVRTLLPIDLTAYPIAAAGPLEMREEFAIHQAEDITDPDQVLEPEPDIDDIMPTLVSQLLWNRIFLAMLASKASEHLARRVAMKQATDAANDMIRDLRKLYNKTRQSKITNELIEILSAAKAIR